MTDKSQTLGIALLCDLEGKIRKIIRDELGITETIQPDQLITLMVDRGSLSKALSFLTQLRANGAEFDWELNVPVNGQATSLHFAGGVIEENLLIVGAKTSSDVLSLYRELMEINNEQINALRQETKARTRLADDQQARDSNLYDEISHLNNELVNLQRELTKKNVELEKLNELKNQFLGIAAHDLRSPLSVILSYSGFMLDEAQDVLDQEQIEFLHIMQTSSNFMLQLVNDLLDVSTIESGQLTLNSEIADLNAVIRRNTTLNRVLAQKKKIQLLCELPEQIPPVIIDVAKIEQVLNNLIGNAIKYSPPDTKITVRAVQESKKVTISVCDEGPGVPENELDKLFRFFGTTSVRAPDGEKSTGLGLAIAHKIVTGHNGEIWVESQVGQGTTFYVSLPIQEEL
jgi:signal transduction histidine kinase